MTTSNYELRERIEAVSNASGGGDDLLTVAIPPEESLGETLERVEEEYAEAEYIHADESSTARRAVLERTKQILHEYGETPDGGLVVYVGVTGDEEDLSEYVFDDLPNPIREERYEWSNEFDAEALAAAAGDSSTYGLLVVERGGAALGRFDGDRVEAVETIDSDVMGKTKAGGQSADRFERDRARQKEEFFDDVAAEAERAFLEDGAGEDGAPTVDGLLVGGTTVTVEEFEDGDHLDHRLRDAVVGGTFSVEYATEQGLTQLAEKGRDAMDDAEGEEVREALERFRDGLRDDGDDEVAYGEEEVERALEFDAVETLLVSGARPVEDLREYEERVTEAGGEFVAVPPDTEDGARFAEAFGVAAVLRFPVE
ncbi:Vms1/Ankzf1 family peptidyl-tRNA hydrolase [Halopelagius longus]|uniref:Peptide chain release factor 1 n=1 Tax=Halopelagius longus TaxID=1236180 RepID=A0A1H0Y6J9_9EURY|nr:Vms1/Ankzf1 family peptidyl-tRNA hydrolase [Halopelagius longus]RDI72306.1 peptide chain release factor 1 [Halopelagius longus]SDQ10765.1 peptide chain release factor subunit 1 [Halopelagius longus]